MVLQNPPIIYTHPVFLRLVNTLLPDYLPTYSMHQSPS